MIWQSPGLNPGKSLQMLSPMCWPSQLITKLTYPNSFWGQEEKGTTEDEMAGLHHWLDGCESVNSGSWWWTGRPGVLRFMGLQRVGHNWATDLIWSELILMNSSRINPLCKHKVAYRFLVALMYFAIMSLVGHEAFPMSSQIVWFHKNEIM